MIQKGKERSNGSVATDEIPGLHARKHPSQEGLQCQVDGSGSVETTKWTFLRLETHR